MVLFCLAQLCVAQDDSENKSWSASSQQQDPSGNANPTRTSETHTKVDGRVTDNTSVESLGPDGRYVPYLDVEKESSRIDGTTVRHIERTFGRGPDGQKTLVQVTQEESHSLPGGEERVVRTISNPDANGALQLVRRELEDSKQLSPGVRELKTTVLTPDQNGGLTPSVQIEERQTQSGADTVEFKKSTLFSDGAGHWQLSEVREGIRKEEHGKRRNEEERVLRPDSDGKLAIVERTVSRQTETSPGEKHHTVETYSVNVPGVAGSSSLQLVQRETAVRTNSAAHETSIRQIDRLNPAAPGDDLKVTEQVIDIVRPAGNGIAEQQHAILIRNSDGRLNGVSIDVGKTTNPAAIQVSTGPSAKPQ